MLQDDFAGDGYVDNLFILLSLLLINRLASEAHWEFWHTTITLAFPLGIVTSSNLAQRFEEPSLKQLGFVKSCASYQSATDDDRSMILNDCLHTPHENVIVDVHETSENRGTGFWYVAYFSQPKGGVCDESGRDKR